MQTNQLNQWLSFGANVGVIVGLILLIVELDQNSDIARLQLEQSRNDTYQQGEFALYGDHGATVWAKSVMEPSTLSAADIRILDGYLSNAMNRSSKVYELELAGLNETGATIQYMRDNFPYDFGNQYALNWWKYEREFYASGEELLEMADAVMSEIDPDYNKNRIINLQIGTANPSSSN